MLYVDKQAKICYHVFECDYSNLVTNASTFVVVFVTKLKFSQMKTKFFSLKLVVILLVAMFGSQNVFAQVKETVYGSINYDGFKAVSKGAMWAKRPEAKEIFEGRIPAGIQEIKKLETDYLITFVPNEHNKLDGNFIIFPAGEIIYKKDGRWFSARCGNEIQFWRPLNEVQVVEKTAEASQQPIANGNPQQVVAVEEQPTQIVYVQGQPRTIVYNSGYSDYQYYDDYYSYFYRGFRYNCNYYNNYSNSNFRRGYNYGNNYHHYRPEYHREVQRHEPQRHESRPQHYERPQKGGPVGAPGYNSGGPKGVGGYDATTGGSPSGAGGYNANTGGSPSGARGYSANTGGSPSNSGSYGSNNLKSASTKNYRSSGGNTGGQNRSNYSSRGNSGGQNRSNSSRGGNRGR